jgi:hypothetical protein
MGGLFARQHRVELALAVNEWLVAAADGFTDEDLRKVEPAPARSLIF